ncbi:nickel pincer cofactor biosynthesis protein LarC [Dialister invisus]|uniref:nickel pincer cofactor biosynthesis protein LarC n=1 Tax=Dialister invisus TaxID=218538 RepID=UPI0023F5629A|nr:nickel pincer cofactor biosynthesis protein LarC [Dialister invisus]
MDKKLYLDCGSGISGDMFVAAMIDLGADPDALEKALDSLPADGFFVEISRVKKAGIDCCDFHVHLDDDCENHDHDMDYLYGNLTLAAGSGCSCHEESDREEHHCHCHEEGHDGEAHHCCRQGKDHHHTHRGLAEILPMIDACDMTETAKALARKIFRIIGEAEAKAHDLPLDKVHFHEVGALDSIVDVVAAAVTFDSLHIKEVIVPKLTEGTGTVRCRHGVMPVPVPATVNIVSAYKIPMELTGAKGEYVTPTGAAIAAAISTSHQLPPSFVIKKAGLGAGKRAYTDRSGILRAFLIQGEENEDRDKVVKLETDIDDCSGEVLGYVMKKLFKAGAKDVHYAPVFMKKNRPAWELTVICGEGKAEELEQIIFTETTTIGIREYPLGRSVLDREEKEVETVYGKASVKQVSLGKMTRAYPEYDTVKKLAKKNKVPFMDVFDAVKEAAKKK